MTSDLPNGVITASLTPMHEDFSVDHKRLISHCRWLLDQGSDGIALLGTTGEANSLSIKERMQILDAVVDAGISPFRLLVGTGCCAFPDSVELTRHALEYKVGGVLMLPPFYYKEVSDNGLFASFANIIERIGSDALRIYLYHFPKMSATPLSHNLIEELLKHYPSVVAGIKDSSGDWNNMRTMTDRFPGFRVYAGTEQFLLDILRIGGTGCISATTNVTIPLAARVYTMRDREIANELQQQLTKIRLDLQQYSFIPALKALTANRTGDEDWNFMRPPHLSMSRRERVNIVKLVAQTAEI